MTLFIPFSADVQAVSYRNSICFLDLLDQSELPEALTDSECRSQYLYVVDFIFHCLYWSSSEVVDAFLVRSSVPLAPIPICSPDIKPACSFKSKLIDSSSKSLQFYCSVTLV